jgi:Cu+-exporting ATPase
MEKDISLDVKGMHCQSCEMLITEELKELHGVSDIRVSQKDSAAQMRMDPKVVTVAEILDAVKRAGYDGKVKSNGNSHVAQTDLIRADASTVMSGKPVRITIETTTDAFPVQNLLSLMAQAPRVAEFSAEKSSTKRMKLDISGMHCSSCAGLIERTIKKVPGVTQANVNFAAEKASIIFDEHAADSADLVAAVQKAGYKASIIKEGVSIDETAKRSAEVSHLFHLFIRSSR